MVESKVQPNLINAKRLLGRLQQTLYIFFYSGDKQQQKAEQIFEFIFFGTFFTKTNFSLPD